MILDDTISCWVARTFIGLQFLTLEISNFQKRVRAVQMVVLKFEHQFQILFYPRAFLLNNVSSHFVHTSLTTFFDFLNCWTTFLPLLCHNLDTVLSLFCHCMSLFVTYSYNQTASDLKVLYLESQSPMSTLLQPIKCSDMIQYSPLLQNKKN